MIRTAEDAAHDPRQQEPLADSAPTFDLQLCAREPIHAPAAIQPHGALIVALADGLLVSHASANLAVILGRPAAAVLGLPLREAIGEAACRALMSSVASSAGGLAARAVHILAGPNESTLYLHAHRSGRHICVDIEPIHFQPRHRLPILLAQAVLKSFEEAANATDLCKLAVLGLKSITGYDRVMAYRFGEDGHGEVIAEARADHVPPFLGLRYPASDVPPQARQLYLRQRTGAVADANYAPVALLADSTLDDGAPLDLTHSVLRSVSPIHREYMRNMDTAASLTIGLAHRQGLWGMLVCHHQTAMIAGPELRAAADTIGQVVSLLLGSLGEAEASAARLERSVTLRAVVDQLESPLPLPDAFAAAAADLLRLVNATGALLRFAGANIVIGHAPPPAAASQAMALLQARAKGAILALDDLSVCFPELADCAIDGSGALLLPLPSGTDDAILWFRPESSRVVTWGGDPTAHGAIDPLTARISPRASFAAWKETVRGRSAPWTEVDLALARDLAEAVQAQVVRRTKSALLEAEANLGLLAEHSGIVVARSNLDGVRSYVSPASERVLGWRPEEIVGRSAVEFTHPDDQSVLRDANDALLAGSGQSSATYRFRRPDGSWLWVDGYARLQTSTNDEVAKSYVVVLRDATERKANEHKLLEEIERVEQMAATDGLTGLANRRHLDVVSDREWRGCFRERTPLSVLLVDADRFKLFNDHYGHLAGDDCLRAIASQFAAVATRPGDFVARYGGEEFVMLMRNTGHAGALLVATRLCRRVQDLGLVHAGNAAWGVVTVSIGVATAWPRDPKGEFKSVGALFAAADAALYRAKAGGRNRVESHSEPAESVDPCA